jgi:hypothetical protein
MMYEGKRVDEVGYLVRSVNPLKPVLTKRLGIPRRPRLTEDATALLFAVPRAPIIANVFALIKAWVFEMAFFGR